MSQSCKVLKVVPLTETVLDCLITKEITENEIVSNYNTIGGILSDTKYAWYANGPRFEVINSSTGVKIAAWVFGSVLRDTTTKVICVAEIPSSNRDLPLLVVGLECVLTGGSVCVFDLVTSKVLRAVQIKNKVTSIHVIDSGTDIFPLLGPLRSFDGVIAVGTTGGDVLLVDLCRHTIDDARYVNNIHEIKDEINFCEIITLTTNDIVGIERHKQRTAQAGDHLAIHINAVLNSFSPHFVLKGPKDEDRIHVNKSEVTVSATYYCPQLGCLFIGYNFGALQIWNLIDMTLIYTSPVYEENIPISHFAVQEPTDDPRAYCYLWAVYSNTEPYHSGSSVAVLYSLNYNTKEWHEGYGYLYQDLQSCTIRFQTTLTNTQCNKPSQGAYCLRLKAFNKGYSSRSTMPESHEDTLTLCTIIWNVWFADKTMKTYLSIFDLNQWYKEQMPSSPNPDGYQRYMYYVCLSEVLDTSVDQNLILLDAHINDSTIRQFIGVQKPEEHYYPSTLSFECCAISDSLVAFVYNQGHQRALIRSLETSGALILLKPQGTYELSIKLGLTPLFSEGSLLSAIHFQREFLLNVILEQQMVGWLCNCASSWCNGSYTSVGCSLDVFLTWAWNRASVLKTNADQLCVPLFDYSYAKLDMNVKRILNNTIKQLTNLCTIYEYICKKLETFLSSPDIAVQQWSSLRMVSVHLEVLQWLLNVGLLPENHVSTYTKDNQLESTTAPYPVESLVEYYNERRVALHNLSNEKMSLLFIDNLIDIECGGVKIQKQWENDGGNGLYPPPSLQALLRTYLINEVNIMHKHCVVIYVFLDLAMALDQERYKFVVTHLIKFPAVFKLSPSIIKMTQAFWQMDHGDFETAMEQLLDPLISPEDLKPWHHRTILNALLAQQQYNHALLYLQVRRPSLSDVEDIYKVISLLVANEMLDEAFYFQRNNSTKKSEINLLHKIFEECMKTNQIQKLIPYGLNSKEEEVLMNYLKEVDYEEYEKFQVMFYLKRSRYMEIFEMQSGQKRKLGQSGLVGQKKQSFQEDMVETLSSFFPKVTKSIMNVCHQERSNLWKQISKPKPMSVFIHNVEEQAKYKSTLIHASVAKARETWSNQAMGDKLISAEIPFLRTPIFNPSPSRKKTPIICPKIISYGSISSEEISSPSKKMRLSPRQSIDSKFSPANNMNLTHLFKLDTPVVKRKTLTTTDAVKSDEKYKICTPQSILKVKNLVTHSSQSSSVVSTPDNNLEDEFKENLVNISTSSMLKQSFCLTPRKSVSRTLVHFEKTNDSSVIDNTQSSNQSKSIPDLLAVSVLSDENDKIKSLGQNMSKNSSQSTETYYSPDSSLSIGDAKDISESIVTPKEIDVTLENTVHKNPKVTTHLLANEQVPSRKSKKLDLSSSSGVSIKNTTTKEELLEKISSPSPTISAVKGKQTDLSSPSDGIVRRYSKRKSLQAQNSAKKEESLLETKSSSSISQSPIGRVTRRKSLSRRVLENNAFSSLITSANTSNKSLSTKVETRKSSETTTNESVTSVENSRCDSSDVSLKDLSGFERSRHCDSSNSSLWDLLQNSSFTSDDEKLCVPVDNNELLQSNSLQYKDDEKDNSMKLQLPPEKVSGRRSVHSLRSSPNCSSAISKKLSTTTKLNTSTPVDKNITENDLKLTKSLLKNINGTEEISNVNKQTYGTDSSLSFVSMNQTERNENSFKRVMARKSVHTAFNENVSRKTEMSITKPVDTNTTERQTRSTKENVTAFVQEPVDTNTIESQTSSVKENIIDFIQQPVNTNSNENQTRSTEENITAFDDIQFKALSSDELSTVNKNNENIIVDSDSDDEALVHDRPFGKAQCSQDNNFSYLQNSSFFDDEKLDVSKASNEVPEVIYQEVFTDRIDINKTENITDFVQAPDRNSNENQIRSAEANITDFGDTQCNVLPSDGLRTINKNNENKTIDSDSDDEALVHDRLFGKAQYSQDNNFSYLQNSSFFDDDKKLDVSKASNEVPEIHEEIFEDHIEISANKTAESTEFVRDKAAENVYEDVAEVKNTQADELESSHEMDASNLNENVCVDIIEIGDSTDTSKEDSFHSDSSSELSSETTSKMPNLQIEISSSSDSFDSEHTLNYQENTMEEKMLEDTNENEDNVFIGDIRPDQIQFEKDITDGIFQMSEHKEFTTDLEKENQIFTDHSINIDQNSQTENILNEDDGGKNITNLSNVFEESDDNIEQTVQYHVNISTTVDQGNELGKQTSEMEETNAFEKRFTAKDQSTKNCLADVESSANNAILIVDETDFLDNLTFESDQIDISHVDILDATKLQKTRIEGNELVKKESEMKENNAFKECFPHEEHSAENSLADIDSSANNVKSIANETDFLDNLTFESVQTDISQVDILDATKFQKTRTEGNELVKKESEMKENNAIKKRFPDDDQSIENCLADVESSANNAISIVDETKIEDTIPDQSDVFDTTLVSHRFNDKLQIPDKITNMFKADEDTDTKTAGKMQLRKRRSSTNSAQELQVNSPRSLRKRSGSLDQKIDVTPQFSLKEESTFLKSKSKSEEPKNVLAEPINPRKRSLRSSSMDTPVIKEDINVQKRRTRKASSVTSFPINSPKNKETSNEVGLPKTRSQRRLLSSLAAINEVTEQTTDSDVKDKSKKEEMEEMCPSTSATLEDYSSFRRLTRHQKNILESAKKKINKDISAVDVEALDVIDPIKLLDKPLFEGKKDPEEQRILDSSPSSIADSYSGEKRKTRRISHDSNSSVITTIQSVSEGGSPKHTPSKSAGSSTSGMNLRRRRCLSAEESVESGISRSKKGRHTKQNDDTPTSIRKLTRNRSKTPDIPDTESTSSRKSARKQIFSTKAQLSEIPEEKSEDSIKEQPEIRRGRSMKSSKS